MVEDLINRNIIEKIIIELLTTGKVVNYKEYDFDENLFCLLLLDIKDKGLQRVKKILLQDYTQEKSNSQPEKGDFDMGQRTIKPNLEPEDKFYFQQAVKVIDFLNQEVVKKASEYSSYIESLRIKINYLEKNDIYLHIRNGDMFPTEEEYINLTNELKEKDEITVAKEIINNKEIDPEFNLNDLDFKNRTNKKFFDKILTDIEELKHLEKDNSLTKSEKEDLIKQKKNNIKLKLQISIIDYNVKMKDVIAKNNNWELEKDLVQER